MTGFLLLKIAAVWYGFFSLTLFLVYGIDKSQAIANGRRIPEKVFHYLALAGGFPGGLIGRPLFHHKTRKPAFLLILLIAMTLHGVLWFVVWYLFQIR